MRILYRLVPVVLFVPLLGQAHAFGQQFTLPLPVSFYFIGAAAALIASFAILTLFNEPQRGGRRVGKKVIVAAGLSRAGVVSLRVLGLLWLLLTIVSGFFGAPDYQQNPAVYLLWIVFLLALTYAQALVNGIWQAFNPFRTLAATILGKNHKPLFRYPRGTGFFPALILYFGLISLELLSGGAGAIPEVVAAILLGYVGVSFIGSFLFGTAVWFTYGDLFSVFFGLVGKFAPIQLSSRESMVTPPGERLIEERGVHLTELFFILFALSSTAFDGIMDTEPWMSVMNSHPFLLTHPTLISFFVLLLSPFLFFLLYGLAIYLMRLVVGAGYSFNASLLRFAYSLVPIAIAYHFAHYFQLILTEGQRLIPQLSDPLGKGWNLFGTKFYEYKVGIIGAASGWYLQVGAIILGHIVATYIAHRIALSEFDSKRHVILGQIPMLFLMVCYTVFGLWILSLPYAIGA